MKLIKTLSCLLILSFVFVSVAEARSSGFGGGFRSQRVAPAPQRAAPAPQRAAPQQAAPAPAAQTTQAKSTFGSFGAKPTAAGTAPSVAPQNAQPLNMSKDLSANAAQSNAMKTNDARTGAAAASNTAAAGNSGWFRSGNSGAARATPMQAAQPVMQHSGGGFMNNVMWFMLGSSIANSFGNNHHNDNTQYNHGGAQPTSTVANANGQTIDPLTGMAAPVEEKESFLMSIFRFAVWAGIIFGVYKLITNIRKSKKNRASKKPNYTFGN